MASHRGVVPPQRWDYTLPLAPDADPSLERGEGFAEPACGGVEMLGDDLDITKDRHEVRVSGPPRHDMNVHVLDTCSGGGPDVQAEVETVGGEPSLDGPHRPLHGGEEDGSLFAAQVAQVVRVARRRNEHVPRAVWKAIEHHHGLIGSGHDQFGVESAAFNRVADEALRGARRLAADVGHAPGSPQLSHRRARYPMRPTRRRQLRSESARSSGRAETQHGR